MCFNLDYYIFEKDDKFAEENRNFLRKSMMLLYFICFVYLLLIYYVSVYIL